VHDIHAAGGVVNDAAHFYLGYFMTLIAEYEKRTGRTVGPDWRLVLYKADYAHLDDKTGANLAQIENALGVPICAVKHRFIEIVEGKPESVSGRMIIVPPEGVERLGVK
jgi:hypothetical protein